MNIFSFVRFNLYVGKGRDVGLYQIALFEGKAAGGNGEQVLSRDAHRIGQLFISSECYLSFSVLSVTMFAQWYKYCFSTGDVNWTCLLLVSYFINLSRSSPLFNADDSSYCIYFLVWMSISGKFNFNFLLSLTQWRIQHLVSLATARTRFIETPFFFFCCQSIYIFTYISVISFSTQPPPIAQLVRLSYKQKEVLGSTLTCMFCNYFSLICFTILSK